MRKSNFAALAAAGALAISAGAATAGVVHFDLGDGPTVYNQESLYYEVDGLGLTVKGESCGWYSCSDEDIDRYSGSGIAMNRNYWDWHTVDGHGRNEYLNLHFSDHLKLKSVSFNYVSYGSDFVLYTWDGDDWDYEGEAPADGGTYHFVGSYEGDQFSIGAEGHHDSWKLAGISVHYMAPIPLPAAGWMLLAGIGGIAAMKRRKKVAA